jgi:putative membrane protein
MDKYLHIDALIATGVFSLAGLIILFLTFIAFDLLTPGKLWDEICKEKNLPLALVTSAMIIAIAQIIASSIHG